MDRFLNDFLFKCRKNMLIFLFLSKPISFYTEFLFITLVRERAQGGLLKTFFRSPKTIT